MGEEVEKQVEIGLAKDGSGVGGASLLLAVSMWDLPANKSLLDSRTVCIAGGKAASKQCTSAS